MRHHDSARRNPPARCFTLLLLLLLPGLANGYTTPGTGVVWNGDSLVVHSGGAVTWNETEQRYELSEELEIAAGDSVTIGRSIYSFHNDDPDLRVNGALLLFPDSAIPEDSLYVTGDTDDGPGGLRVEDSGRAYLYHVVMIGGGAAVDRSGARTVGGWLSLEGCRLTDWGHHAVSFTGGSGEVLYSQFHDNHDTVINITLGANVTVRGCTLENNNLANPGSARNPISIGAQGNNEVLVEDCLITGQPGNRHGGISVSSFFGDSMHATIRRCTVQGAAFGIVVYGTGATATITDCLLQGNTAIADPMTSGSGITVQQSAVVLAARNRILENHWGVTTLTNGRIHLGRADASDPDSMGYNTLLDNGNGGVTYALYNNTALPLEAENNWWGADNMTGVEEVIFHQDDDPGLGPVDYLPFWVNDGSPVVLHAEPADTLIIAEPGTPVRFEVDAFDPEDDPLAYEWYAGDDLVSTADTALVIAAEDTLGVLAILYDPTDDPETRLHWTIVPPPVNHPPMITGREPDPDDNEVLAGPSVTLLFVIRAEDPDGDSLSYEFRARGEVISTGDSAWVLVDFEPSFLVSAWVTDPGGLEDSTSWVVIPIWSAPEGEALPRAFDLAAYPNPFNAALRVRFSLPQPADARLEVFSLEGRRLALLAAGRMSPGAHEITWEAGEAASGLYFIRLTTPERSLLRKVVLLK